jgi:hypothetical protein
VTTRRRLGTRPPRQLPPLGRTHNNLLVVTFDEDNDTAISRRDTSRYRIGTVKDTTVKRYTNRRPEFRPARRRQSSRMPRQPTMTTGAAKRHLEPRGRLSSSEPRGCGDLPKAAPEPSPGSSLCDLPCCSHAGSSAPAGHVRPPHGGGVASDPASSCGGLPRHGICGRPTLRRPGGILRGARSGPPGVT